jgi:hypothetical protein
MIVDVSSIEAADGNAREELFEKAGAGFGKLNEDEPCPSELHQDGEEPDPVGETAFRRDLADAIEFWIPLKDAGRRVFPRGYVLPRAFGIPQRAKSGGGWIIAGRGLTASFGGLWSL